MDGKNPRDTKLSAISNYIKDADIQTARYQTASNVLVINSDSAGNPPTSDWDMRMLPARKDPKIVSEWKVLELLIKKDLELGERVILEEEFTSFYSDGADNPLAKKAANLLQRIEEVYPDRQYLVKVTSIEDTRIVLGKYLGRKSFKARLDVIYAGNSTSGDFIFSEINRNSSTRNEGLSFEADFEKALLVSLKPLQQFEKFKNQLLSRNSQNRPNVFSIESALLFRTLAESIAVELDRVKVKWDATDPKECRNLLPLLTKMLEVFSDPSDAKDNFSIEAN